MLDVITDHIDVWTSAEKKKSVVGRSTNSKLELYGIKKLRELILDLAVQGKLVPQDPNDEPANELLKKIELEKYRLIKEKKIKKQNKLPKIADEEKMFKIPSTWTWVRLIDLYYSISPSGKKLKNSDMNESGTYPVVDQGQSYVAGYTDKKDLLIDIPGPVIIFGDHTTTKKYVDFNFVAGADGTKILRPYKMNERFFYTYLLTYKLEGRGYARYFKMLNDNIMALPPLNEQERIIQKVNELLALCDQLEQEETDNKTAHKTLVNTLLKTIISVKTAEEFAQSWQQISEHFDILFTTEESIEQLKQTILQLAVMGKLIQQDPNNKPVSELLKKIEEDKKQLVVEGKVKKQKILVDFTGLNEMKWEIPSAWEWIRLDQISDIVRGGSPRPAGDLRFYGGDIPFLKVADVTRIKGKFICTRTVLLSNSGATLGIPAICDFDTAFNDGIAAFSELSTFVFDEYLYLYLKSLSKWFLDIASRGQGQPNLNTDIIKATWFALPPVEEQKCIVAKVDELFTLCDFLKTNICEAQETQVLLADAIVQVKTEG